MASGLDKLIEGLVPLDFNEQIYPEPGSDIGEYVYVPRCAKCSIELSETLDKYWGKDPRAEELCSKCRRQYEASPFAFMINNPEVPF
jgi:hypothetical protein